MKKIILLIISLSLANFMDASETLTIAPAHGFSDYTKCTVATGNSNRLFLVGFAVGDFNKDGRLDLVVQTGTKSTGFLPFGAQMFLGETNGTFTKGAERILPNTGVTWDLLPQDFNEDGNLDILMEDSNNDMVLMLGNGDGTFQPAQFLGLSAAGYFAVADLDGDEHLDIVAGKLDGTVGVFAGTGDGNFSLKATLDTQVQPLYPRRGEILLGDLNRDGQTDISVASVQNGSPSQPGNLDVFLGNGDGTFQSVMRTTGVGVRRGALGDFNGDGVLDYAGDRGSPEQLEIWFGSGDGHFTSGPTYSLSGVYSLAYGIKVGDINSDGIRDIIMGGENGIPAAPLSIFLGNGDGTFRPRIPFTQANGNLPINTGPQLVDFNGDGFLDILTLSWLGTNMVTELEAMSIALSHGVKEDTRLGFLINVQRPAGSTSAPVILEASSNLVSWTDLATNLSISAKWSFTDTSTNLNYRFYKTRNTLLPRED